LVDFIAKKRYPTIGMNCKAISTLAIDTGRYMTEFGPYLYATGNPQEGNLLLLADFGNFDQSQAAVNFRSVMIEAAMAVRLDNIDYLNTRKYGILGGETIMDRIIINWEGLMNAVFRVYTGNAKYMDLETGWLYSGENATLVINTMVNYAFVLTVLERMFITPSGIQDKSLADIFKFENFKLQGDDQIAVLSLIDPNISVENQLPAEKALLELLNTVCETAGLEISVNKTGLRRGHFEFLKKAGMWGYPVPRYTQISLEEQENINRTMDPIERFRARLGQYREYEFRGGSTIWGLVRRYLEWNITRGVKFMDSNGDSFSLSLPFELIWTPVSDGGIGMDIMTNVDPNIDIMISLHDWSPEVRTKINACIQVLKSTPPKNIDNIVKQVSEDLSEGLAREKTYDYSIHIEKINNSKAAYERLMNNKGMKDDRSAYFKRYDQELKEAIEDDKHMEVINIKWKQERSYYIIKHFKYLMENESEINDMLKDKFIPGVSFKSGNIIENRNLPFCPIVGLDINLQLWFKQIGTSSEDRVITGEGFSRLSSLLNKGNFPRNLKANNIENIARDILGLHLTSIEDIADFLIMRGADTEQATQVASTLSKRIDMLNYLADISMYSSVGEGFTDK